MVFRILAVVLAAILTISMPLQAAVTQIDDDELAKLFELFEERIQELHAQQKSFYGSSPAAGELEDAINWLHSQGITKFDTPISFMATQAIRRDEAATMFYRFVQAEGRFSSVVVNNNCDFPDLSQAHADLIPVVKSACGAGLFYGADGLFLPVSPITNAQAITVMARILDGKKDENIGHRADNYYTYLAAIGVMTGLPMINKSNYGASITRGDIALLLWRVHNTLG